MLGLTKTSGSLAVGLASAVFATVVVTAATPRKPAAPIASAKVDVCHWSEEDGSWKKLSIGEPALAAHLRNHDDAVPGGVTAGTSTQLDEECQAPSRLLTCPCWNQYTHASLAAALNAETNSNPMCSINDPGATAAFDLNDPIPNALAENGTSTDCLLRLTGSDTGLMQLTQEQANACNAELAAVIPHLLWCAPHK